MAQKIIGLDLGTYSIKVVQVESSFRSFKVTGFAEEVIPLIDDTSEEEGVGIALRRLYDTGALKGDVVICSLPTEQVMTTTLTVPFDDPKKIEATLPFLLEGVVPISTDEQVLDFQVIGPAEDDQFEVMVDIARKDDVSRLLEQLALVQIEPQIISAADIELANLAHYIIGDSEECYAILDIGHKSSKLCIVENGQLSVSRTILRGGNQITESLVDTFEIPYDRAEEGKHREGFIGIGAASGSGDQLRIAEAIQGSVRPLLRELRQSFTSYFIKSRSKISKIYVSGGTTLLKNYLPFLASELNIDVQPLPLLKPELSLDELTIEQQAIVTTALAMALRGTNIETPNKINLRLGDFAYQGGFEYVKAKIRGVGIGFAVFFLALMFMFLARYYSLQKEAQVLEENLKTKTVQLFGNPMLDYKQIKTKMVGKGKGKAAIAPKVSASDIFLETNYLVPEDMEIDIDLMEIDVTRKVVFLRGNLPSTTDLERLVKVLEEYECFDANDIKKENLQQFRTNKLKFELRIASSCE